MSSTRPPLGITPKWLWREERMWALIAALERIRVFVQEHGEGHPHEELLKELHELIGQVNGDRMRLTQVAASGMTATDVLEAQRETDKRIRDLDHWNEAHRGMGDPTGKSARFEHGETRITEAAQ